MKHVILLLTLLCSFTWAQDQSPVRNILTTKGDTFVSAGGAVLRQPVCPNDQVRVADSTAATGWKCAAVEPVDPKIVRKDANDNVAICTTLPGACGAVISPTTGVDGLQIELSGRQDNLVQWSESLQNTAVWAPSNAAYNASTGLLIEDTNNTRHKLSQPFPTVASTWYTYTVWAKANTRSRFTLREDTASGAAASFDLAAGAVLSVEISATATITAGSDGYWKCSMNRAYGAGPLTFTLYMLPDAGTSFADTSFLGESKSIYIQKTAFTRSMNVPYVSTTGLGIWANLAGWASGTLVNGPVWSGISVSFDGTNDQVTGLPAKGAAWTVAWANRTKLHAVDSSGNYYVNGISNLTTEADIRTAGGHAGEVTFYRQYDRLLPADKHARLYYEIRDKLAQWPYPVSIGWGLDATEASAARATSYLTIPTYDGSGQTVHPSVKYVAAGWNGYKYWMAFSPFAGGSDALENPSIVASNDGVAWVVPPGLTNPIVAKPDGGINTDPEIFFSADGVTMYLLNRQVIGTAEAIQLLSSTDGATWASVGDIVTSNNTNDIVSPAVLYDPVTAKYIMWSHKTSTSKVQRRTATVPGGPWSAAADTNAPASDVRHLGVDRADGYFRMFYAGNTGLPMNYCVSADGLTFANGTVGTLARGAAGQWDDALLYRPSAIRDASGLWLYYSAQDSQGKWHIGRTATSLK